MAEPASSTQRHYRAPCPGCGAPVEFRSAQSTHAVCGYCQSTVVRDGEVLKRLGKMAELFDDHSLLQLGAAGRFDQRAFTLVGRLQYKYREGSWTEWVALFDDGTTGSLSEDNGAYVFALPVQNVRSLPAASALRVGLTTAIQGQAFTVASSESVALMSAQGELPHLPPLGQSFALVELRSRSDTDESPRVLSLDYGSEPPSASLGRPVTLDELAITGLKSESGKEEKGRQFACPNCGAAVSVTLDQSRSVTCGQCNSLIDISAGVGGELRHAEQAEPVRPLIALGTVGQLEGGSWQVVGFQHRMGTEPDDPDEHFGWSEYLLYNARKGFCFLVDAEDGWSLVRPVTGAPALARDGQSAKYLGKTYALQYAYRAETTYVAGEFYWQVQRGQTTDNSDFASGPALLSREQTPSEVTWSAGEKLGSDTVAKAFRMTDRKEQLQRADPSPVSASRVGIGTIIILLVVLLLVLTLLSRCSRCDPKVENCSSGSTTRSSGGSWGGYSGGGSHK